MKFEVTGLKPRRPFKPAKETALSKMSHVMWHTGIRTKHSHSRGRREPVYSYSYPIDNVLIHVNAHLDVSSADRLGVSLRFFGLI